MKSLPLALVILCSVSLGCGQSTPVMTKAPPGYHGGQPTPPAPEEAITKLETPEDKAQYLRQLASDSSFKPEQHAELLKKCAADSNEELASAAKQLLERN
jgi:hypothetical protein